MYATIGGMGVEEIGQYIYDCVKANGLTIACVTAQAGVEPNYIWRLRKGRIKSPGVHTLRALTDAAKGAWDVVSELLNGTNSTAPDPRQAFDELAETLTDDELPDAIAAIERMRISRRSRKTRASGSASA